MLSGFYFYLIPEPPIFLLIMISVVSYSDIKILFDYLRHMRPHITVLLCDFSTGNENVNTLTFVTGFVLLKSCVT